MIDGSTCGIKFCLVQIKSLGISSQIACSLSCPESLSFLDLFRTQIEPFSSYGMSSFYNIFYEV